MTEFAICETPQVLRVIYFIKIIIDIIKIVVPISLIVMITIECAKGVINGEQKIEKVLNLNKNKLLSAILIFSVPTLVDIALEIIDEKTDYKSCWVNAEKASIEKYQLLWDENEKRKEEEEQKRKEEEQQQQEEQNNNGGNLININSSKKFTMEYKSFDSVLSYALYTPTSLKENEEAPLLISLHGLGSVGSSESAFKKSNFLNVLNNWKLKGFNAYVLCPHLKYGNWNSSTQKTSFYKLLNKITSEYNIDNDNIVLSGHSLGGIGVPYMANNNADYYSALVVMSGYNSGVDLTQFKNIKNRGYVGTPSSGEDTKSYNYMVYNYKPILGDDKLKVYKTSHGGVVSKAFTEDIAPNDGASDLIVWMFGEDVTVENYTSNSNSGSNNNSNGNSNSNSNNTSGSLAKVNTTDIGCTLYYDPYKKIKKDYLYFQASEADKVHTALKGACSEVNKRSYMSYLQTAGSYVRKNTSSEHSYHAKALAVDLNNLFTFTKNGKTYYPYAGQGVNTWNNYKKFICEVCDGKENCEYNVNYIIYEKYFKPIGWCWGGYFSKKYFDPMHYEKRTGGCATSYKVEITC